MSGFHFFGKGLVSLLKGLFPCDMDNLSSFPLIGSSFPKKNHSPSERLPFPSQEKGVEESPFTVIKYSEPPPEQNLQTPQQTPQTNQQIHLITLNLWGAFLSSEKMPVLLGLGPLLV
jgi:hypothetical protein